MTSSPKTTIDESGDGKVGLCSEMGVTRDKGYSADSEPDGIAFATFTASKTKLGRANQSINTRRALQIMERRAKPKSVSPEEKRPRMRSLSSKVVIMEVGTQGSANWSQQYGTTCTVYVRTSISFVGLASYVGF